MRGERIYFSFLLREEGVIVRPRKTPATLPKGEVTVIALRPPLFLFRLEEAGTKNNSFPKLLQISRMK